MVNFNELKIRVLLHEDMLGTSPANPNIARDYTASRAPDAAKMEEEIAAIGADAYVDKSMTVFPKEDGIPFMWDYQIKGFLKDSAGGLRRIVGSESESVKAYKSVIDTCVFVYPRKIMIHTAGAMGECQRPLRAQTPKGERVSLANSEKVPSGSWMDFTIEYGKVKGIDMEAWLIEMLDYGIRRGLGQWRNSGKGRFEYEILS